MNNSSTTLPLPTSYFPDALDAYHYSIGTYLAVGSLSTLLWDVIIHLEYDYRLLKEPRSMSLICVVYLISRVTTLSVILMETLLLTIPIESCRSYVIPMIALFNVMMASTLLLSYFRVCAVWGMNKAIIIIFGFFWLLGVAGVLTTVTGISSAHTLGSPYCGLTVTNNTVTTVIICPIINHIATLLAITYGVCRNISHTEGNKGIRTNYRKFILGDSLPAFSKAMLQRCQICYLVTTLFGIILVVWFYIFRGDQGYKFAVNPVYIVALNITFSWVFRETRQGNNTTVVPTFNNTANPNAHQSIMLSNTRSNAKFKSKIISASQRDADAACPYPVEINITEIVEYSVDDVEESDRISDHESNV